MIASPIIAIVDRAGDSGAATATRLPAAAPFLLLWLSRRRSPTGSACPVGARVRPLSDDERALLRRTARKTWRYFETFVTEADGWLPPDNYQEAGGAPQLARRTSPTNIGMGLLSTLAAHDLGYLSTADAGRAPGRARSTTLEGLERYHGHFLNWYDTAHAGAAASALRLDRRQRQPRRRADARSRRGCASCRDAPQTRAQRLAGLADTADLLAARIVVERRRSRARGTTSTDDQSPGARDRRRRRARCRRGRHRRARRRSRRSWRGAAAAIEHGADFDADGRASRTGAQRCSTRSRRSTRRRRRVRRRAAGARAPRVGARRRDAVRLPLRPPAAHLLDRLSPRRRRRPGTARRLVLRSAGVGSAAGQLRRDRQGRRAAAPLVPSRTSGHQRRRPRDADVLGRHDVRVSDAAAADAELPRHAARSELPRQRAAADRVRRGSAACRGASRSRRTPSPIATATISTGRSACPGSACKRGLVDDLVDRAVRDGARRAWSIAGGRGRELRAARRRSGSTAASASTRRSTTRRAAATSTPPPDAARAPVDRPRLLRASPGHVARRARQRRLRRRRSSRASTPIRGSRRPSCCCRSACRARRSCRSRGRPRATTAPPSLPVFASRRFRSPHTTSVHTHFLSNGRYTTAVTNAGGGYSMWRDIAVTRRRDDPTSDAGAHYIYLRDPWSGRVWSATYQPVCQEPDQFDATFDLDKVTFRRRDGDIETQLEITVSSEDDVEVRRLTITNRGAQHARDRGHQLRRDRAGASRGRPRASGVRQAVHRDGVRPAERRPAVQPAAARRRRIADRGLPRARRRRPAAGRRRRMGNRSRALHRPRAHRRPIRSALDGRALSGTTGAVLDPIARAARAHPAGAGRRRPRGVRHRRRRRPRRPRWRWRGSIATAARRRAPSRWRSRTCTSRCSISGSATSTRCSSIGWPRACSAADASCISPADLARQHARAAEPVGLRHLRRPADRAGARRRRPTSLPLVAPAAATRRSTGASRACAPTSSSSTSIRPTISTRCRTC